jgi:hypothetical protein
MVADHQGIQHQGGLTSGAFRQACPRIEHDPEKWEPVFRKDHAQQKDEIMIRFNLIGS